MLRVRRHGLSMCGLFFLEQFSIPAKPPGHAPAISCNADSMLKSSSAFAQACRARHASALNVVAWRHPGTAGPSHACIKTTSTRSAPHTSSGHAPGQGSLGSRRPVAVHVWPFDQAWAPSPEVCTSDAACSMALCLHRHLSLRRDGAHQHPQMRSWC